MRYLRNAIIGLIAGLAVVVPFVQYSANIADQYGAGAGAWVVYSGGGILLGLLIALSLEELVARIIGTGLVNGVAAWAVLGLGYGGLIGGVLGSAAGVIFAIYTGSVAGILATSTVGLFPGLGLGATIGTLTGIGLELVNRLTGQTVDARPPGGSKLNAAQLAQRRLWQTRLAIGFGVIFVLASVLWIGFLPCRWLDLWSGRSACTTELRTWAETPRTFAIWPQAESASETWLASGTVDGQVQIWALPDGELRQDVAAHRRQINQVRFSDDGQWLASASADETVRLWNVSTGAEGPTFEGHSNAVTSVDFTSDGSQLISGASDRTVRVWDVASGQEVAQLGDESVGVSSVEISPDDAWVAVGLVNGQIQLLPLLTQAGQPKLLAHHNRTVNVFRFTADGRQLVAGAGDGQVSLWDVAEGDLVTTFALPESAPVESLDFNADETLLTAAAFNGAVYRWDVSTGAQVLAQGFDTPLEAMVLHPAGELLATGHKQGLQNRVRLWRILE